MFKVFLFLLVSTLIPTNNSFGSSSEESDHELTEWPFVGRKLEDGQLQSPINILSQNAKSLKLSSLLYYRYWREDSVEIKIGNNGRALHIHSVRYDDIMDHTRAHITGGPLFKKKYIFSHMHLYWGADGEEGSEHQINSQGYPIEVQMIHYKDEYGHYGNALNQTDGICIISYFGKLSDQDNPKMWNLMAAVQSVQQPRYHFFSTFDVHFHWLMEVAKDYYYYAYPGSITVTPFSQCVTWIIYENTFNISRGQLAVFRSLQGTDDFLTSISRRTLQSFNNRPLCYV